MMDDEEELYWPEEKRDVAKDVAEFEEEVLEFDSLDLLPLPLLIPSDIKLSTKKVQGLSQGI